MDYADVAEQAIDLFLEYRDVHGYLDEDEAKAKAIGEFLEYQNLFMDQCNCGTQAFKESTAGCPVHGTKEFVRE